MSRADDAMRAVVALADSLAMTGAELITLTNSHRLSVIRGTGDYGFTAAELRRVHHARSVIATAIGGYGGLNSVVRELIVMASAPGDNFNE